MEIFREIPLRWHYLLIALCAFLVFAGTLKHDFVWDDEPIIQYTHQIVQQKGFLALFSAPFTSDVYGSLDKGYYRPLTLFTMWANSPTGEFYPFAYHLVNVVLHMSCSLLVFHLLRLLLANGSGPFVGGLLFALHPVHAESVSFVSGRTDLLATLFTLLSVICWYRSHEQEYRGSIARFALGSVFFFLACMSKEVAYLLPGVLLVWVLAKRSGRKGETIRKSGTRWALPWIMGWFAISGFSVFIRAYLLNIGTGPGWSRYAQIPEGGLLSLSGYVATNLLLYIRLTVFPWPLSVFYPPVYPHLSFITWVISLTFIFVCVSISGERHGRIGLTGLVWTVLFLVPVSGLIGLGQSQIAERFCYLPSVGVVMVIAYALHSTGGKETAGYLRPALVACVALFFAAGTVLHSARWKDEVTLFSSAATNPVRVPSIFLSLGNAHRKAGSMDLAVKDYQEVIHLDPGNAKAKVSLAVAYFELGDHEKAAEVITAAEVSHPLIPEIWFSKGRIMEKANRNREALESFQRAAALDSGDAGVRYYMGNLLGDMERYDESIDAYRDAIRIDPYHEAAYVALGRAYRKVGMIKESVDVLMQDLELNGENIAAYDDLGLLYLEKGMFREALAVYRMALKLAPDDFTAHKGFVISSFQLGQVGKARSHIESVKKVNENLYGELLDIDAEMTRYRKDGQ